MSASTLNSLLQDAVKYANLTQYRKSSDKYKELYQLTAIAVVPLNQGHIGYPLRYHSLSGYTSFFRFDQLQANAADFDFLFESMRNKQLPPHERCLIGLTLGFSLWQCSRRDEAIKVYNKTMGLSIEPASRSMSVMFNGGQSTAGSLFDENFFTVKRNLGNLNPDSKYDAPNGIPMDSSFRPTVRCFGGDLSPALQDLISTASTRMIGSKCDHCGASKDHSNATTTTTTTSTTPMKLKSCVKCRRSYYCNAECQKADWKKHKKGCLPPMEFPIGSIIKLQGLINKPELNGRCAIVKEEPEATATDGRYKLSLLEEIDKLLHVKIDNLSLLLAPAEYEDLP